MFRAATVAAMTLVAAVLVSAAPVAEEAKPKDPVRAWQPTRDKLAKPITCDAIPANTSLKDAIEFASEKFEVRVVLETDAFKMDVNIQEPENEPVKLPKMTEVRLETWLRMLLQQVKGDFYVQPDGIIVIVPRETLVKHVMGQQVTTSFDKKPVNEALRQLGDSLGLSIIVDEKRAGDKAKTPVTADLKAVTVEAAILILADLADLKPVTIDRAIYVTTPENAKKIRVELEKNEGGFPAPQPTP